MEAQQASPDSSSEECTVLEALPGKGTALICSQHKGKVSVLYCLACENSVCEDCMNGEHAEHPTDSLENIVDQQLAALQDRVDSAKNRLPQIRRAVQSLRDILQQLNSQRSSIEEDIHSSFSELHKTLDTRKSVLLMELEVTYGLKQKVLQAQLDTLLQEEAAINYNCSLTGEALDGENKAVILQTHKDVGERLGDLASQGLPLQPEENDQLDLMMEIEGLRKSIHNLGTIVTTSAVASQTEASGEGLEQCVVGQPATVVITTRDKSGGLCKTGNAIISAEVCTPDGSVADGEIVDHKNGTYEFQYTVKKEGHFSLALRLYDQHIKGSPFQIKVTSSPDDSPPTTTAANAASTGSSDGGARKRSAKSPGSRSRQKGVRRGGSLFSTPKKRVNPIEDDLIFRIACSSVGESVRRSCVGCLVTGWFLECKGDNTLDFSCWESISSPFPRASRGLSGRGLMTLSCDQSARDERVQVFLVRFQGNADVSDIFSNTGEFQSRFGVRGRLPGQLQRPTGVAVHPNGDIIIADYDNKWVSIFSSEGKYKAKLGSGRLMGPKGVSVDQNGHVIVVDNKACTVFIFQPSGKLVTKFGSRGNGDRQFAGPHFAAVNNNNEIIITDFHNHSVKVFNADGEFLLKFGSNGEGNGQFNAPTGVAVDVNGNIIVADWGNSRIQVFDGSGSFLSYINTAADPLYGPQGLALTSDGHVVVADSGNHCFKVYRYLQ
ncbi:tripartite motif-containing protein 2-like [Sinocyclocheilus rhinocerous]|uniref:tripartite motif-containing protein 2-like n=1 Tax=Sinocyclocheilus rhinocerous TaxID=307959 RepID=UPI0007B86F34|nr:PREDICTED: tripartite motif-containing protein 2-like [Sinocyclocheilus rhinocerous]